MKLKTILFGLLAIFSVTDVHASYWDELFQPANVGLFGPASGGSGTSGFRAMVNADLPTSGVSAGSYTLSNITVNAQGVITAASNGSASPTTYAWYGYHSGGLWNCTASSFGDCTANASISLTQAINTNFGTVTSYVDGSSHDLPGIVVTAPATGTYEIEFLSNYRNNTTGDAALIELVDGSGTMISRANDNNLGSTGTTGLYQIVSMGGFYNMTASSSYTFKVFSQVGGGGNVNLGTGGVVNSAEWRIKLIH
jgi:hypothetical protein